MCVNSGCISSIWVLHTPIEAVTNFLYALEVSSNCRIHMSCEASINMCMKQIEVADHHQYLMCIAHSAVTMGRPSTQTLAMQVTMAQ